MISAMTNSKYNTAIQITTPFSCSVEEAVSTERQFGVWVFPLFV